MRFRKLIVLCSFLLTLLFLSACATGPLPVPPPASQPTVLATPSSALTPTTSAPAASGSKLTVAVDGWGTDDLCAVSMSGDNFLQDYFNPILLDRDENNKIVPFLATAWEISDEGIKFTLNPNARWHDGSPITAEDVKWNLEAQSGKFPEYTGTTDASGLASTISEIQVIDDHNLFIKTKEPNAFLFESISGTGYHSHHLANPKVIKDVGCKKVNETGVGGGGPYKVVQWVPGERILLERWDEYWGDSEFLRAQPKTIEILRVPDGAARFALLQSGQADVVINIPYPIASKLPLSEKSGARGVNPNKGGPWLQLIEGAGTASIVFTSLSAFKDSNNKPTEADLKPFDDPRVREAMELAIDKVAISRDALFGFTKPLAGIYFAGTAGYRPELKVPGFDPAKAKQLLKEAGYENGFSTDLYYGPFPNSAGLKEWLEAAASYWKQVGIEVRLHEIVAEEFYKRFGLAQAFGERERAWRPLAVQTWGRYAGPSIVNYGFHKGGDYVCCYDDLTDELWAKIIKTTNETDLATLLAQLEDHVLAQRWLIPMHETSIVIGYSDRVLSHPIAPYASSFVHLWRVVLRGK